MAQEAQQTKSYYEEIAKDLWPQNLAFIDGQYVQAASGHTFDCVNPANGKLIARVAACDTEDVNRAVQAARRAFDEGVWSQKSTTERKRVLLKLVGLIRDNAEELALFETMDMGKPITDSITSDIPSAADCFEWYAEAIDKIYDEISPKHDESTLRLIMREPIGVVGVVIPWNFPLCMLAWKVAPALAMGNSVLVKPAEQSPLTALRLAELAAEAGIPDGVLNILPGFGPTAGQAIGRHMNVDTVGFTGSTEIGKMFLEYSGQSNMKPVWLECGGKSPNVVFEDCPDLDYIAKVSAAEIFYNQGEVCTALSRLIVHENVKEALLEKIIAETANWQPGDPMDPETKMGAMVSSEQHTRVLDYIQIGMDEGAEIVAGGAPVLQETGGFYIMPTIFEGVRPDMRIAREEIFGPVLSVMTARSDEEAIKLANNTSYGLAATVWTKDAKKAQQATRALKAGTVVLNGANVCDITTPFGGYKQSGVGRDLSLHALDKYSQLKTSVLNYL